MGKVQLLTIYNIYSRNITLEMLVETKLAAQKIGVITMADSVHIIPSAQLLVEILGRVPRVDVKNL
jgi:hypothetical protein